MARDVTRGPGLLIGLGLGGFVDGIVLHQVLQWHHMLSASATDNVGVPTHPVTTVAGLEVNTVWDGFFHVGAWVAVVSGIVLLSRRVGRREVDRPAVRAMWGWVVAGWGVFNLVEGVVDHHLLGIHHVRAGEHQLAYDLGFLAVGAVLLVAGVLLARRASAPRATSSV